MIKTTEDAIDWAKIAADFAAMEAKFRAVRMAKAALSDAIKMRCSCSSFVIQVEGGCVCEKSKILSKSKVDMQKAIDAL